MNYFIIKHLLDMWLLSFPDLKKNYADVIYVILEWEVLDDTVVNLLDF